MQLHECHRQSMGFSAGGESFVLILRREEVGWEQGERVRFSPCEVFNTNRASSTFGLLHVSTGRCGGCGAGEHPNPSKGTSTPSPFLLAGTWRRNKDWGVCLLSQLHLCTHAMTTEPLISLHRPCFVCYISNMLKVYYIIIRGHMGRHINLYHKAMLHIPGCASQTLACIRITSRACEKRFLGSMPESLSR